MKEIPVGRGLVALVDYEDAEAARKYHWRPLHCRGLTYAMTRERRDGKRHTLYLHQLILAVPLGFLPDHVNGNGLDNRRENLRIATRSQNQANRGRTRNNASGFKGVCSYRKSPSTWRAQIVVDGRQFHLGYFGNKEDAARAYDAAALLHFGEFSRLNFPIEVSAQ